jgi:hypothetical protein
MQNSKFYGLRNISYYVNNLELPDKSIQFFLTCNLHV